MVTPPFQFPVIGPLISRHAEDAAFYWSQLDRARTSPQVGFERIQHFSRLQDAHMDGLEVAGSAGWQPAFLAFERWKKAGEAYACTRLAVHSKERSRLDEVLGVVCKRPDELLRGVISALTWSSGAANAVIQTWSEPKAEPVAQVAALRTAALMGRSAVATLCSPLTAYFSSTSPHIRAAACRAAAVADQTGIASLLLVALNDTDLPVRAEAAIALARLGNLQVALPILQECVILQAALQAAATGWYRSQSARRLNRWVMELAWLTSLGSPEAHDVLALLPPRSALTFALGHGDLAHLPFVVEQMGDPEVNRYAGWVWQTLTGFDLAAAGWTLPEPDPSTVNMHQSITEARLDADNGLPQPHQAALHTFTATNSSLASHGKRVLLGRALDIEHAVKLLETAPQAIRVLAAQMLNQAQSSVRINVRAPAPEQRIAMNALHAIVANRMAA